MQLERYRQKDAGLSYTNRTKNRLPVGMFYVSTHNQKGEIMRIGCACGKCFKGLTEKEIAEKLDSIRICDRCKKRKEVKTYGNYQYCAKCFEEVSRGN